MFCELVVHPITMMRVPDESYMSEHSRQKKRAEVDSNLYCIANTVLAGLGLPIQAAIVIVTNAVTHGWKCTSLPYYSMPMGR